MGYLDHATNDRYIILLNSIKKIATGNRIDLKHIFILNKDLSTKDSQNGIVNFPVITLGYFDYFSKIKIKL